MPDLLWPWMLALLVMPWLARWLFPALGDGRWPALRMPSMQWQAGGAAGRRAGAGRVPPLLLLAWLLLVVAAARPQIPQPAAPMPETAREMILAVDLSGSMAEADMRLGGRPVDRLTAVKAVLSDFLERRRGDRIGLVVFGSRAYTLTPLTTDLGTVREQLADMDIAMAGRETAIGDALALSVRRLREASGNAGGEGGGAGSRVVVLLTDGVNNAGVVEPERATALAAAEGVKVHTIGFGREGSAPGLFGMIVPRAQAEIDEAALRAISETTGGRFFRAQDTGTLSQIYAELDRIEARTAEAPPAQLGRDVFHWPLTAAWLVLLVVMLRPGPRERAAP